MADMKDVNDSALFANAIVNKQWAMNEFSNPGSLWSDRTKPGKSREEIDVVQQRGTKSGRGLGVFPGDAPENVTEVV